MKKIIYSAALVLSLSLAACSASEDFTPQEILNNTMQETADLSSYYAEYKIDFGDGEVVTGKQWLKNNKVRSEIQESNGETSIAINDGQQMLSYYSAEKTATIFDMNVDGEGLVQPTLKDQITSMYKLIKDSHEITIGDDAKIAGHDTYHLIAKAKEKGNLFGDMEIWVDKKTWMPLKSITVSGDVTSTTEYTKYEPNAKIEDSVFEIDLPEDVEIKQESIDLPSTISLDEAKLRQESFLILPESTGYTIDSIEDMHVEETNEIAINYTKNDELQFTISIFKPAEPLTEIEKPITVRGIGGSASDMDAFRFLQWEENGLRYNVIFENPDLSYEDFLALADQMVPAQ